MPKRKRGPEEAAVSAVQDVRQQRRIQHAFNQGAHQLAQAFKLAKGFERQKLGRRKKDADKEQDYRTSRRIDAEIRAVKALDANVGAKHYLAKSLLRIKAAAEHPDLPKELSDAAVTTAATSQSSSDVDDAARLNVTARICNSNPVKKVFPAALKEVKNELGLQEHERKVQNKKQRLRAKDYEQVGSENDAVKVERHRRTGKVGATAATSSDESEERGDRGDRRIDDESDESGADSHEEHRQQYRETLIASDDEDEAMERYEAMLASSDDDDENDDGVSDIADLERQLEMEGISWREKPQTDAGYDLAADLSLPEDESDNVLHEESAVPEPSKTAALKKSSFMPSLTLGGYISGSGSDIDEVDVAPPRKNRRGQRARQQIWEQKYGTKAKHLQRQDRNEGWDPKRGASNDRTRGSKGGRGGRGGSLSKRNSSSKNANSIPLATKKPRRDDTGSLHPSWEAAKRAKEKKSAPVAFQGKKISFD